MKKMLLTTSACLLLAAQANAETIKPYIGFDLGAARLKAAGKMLDGSETVASANLNVGAKFNPYFGLEISSQASSDADVENDAELSYSSIAIDAIGYLPLTYQFELFATAGVGYYDFDFEMKHKVDGLKVHGIKNETAFRGGLGAQYNINENWSVRGLARYHHIDNDYFDYIGEALIGVRYNF